MEHDPHFTRIGELLQNRGEPRAPVVQNTGQNKRRTRRKTRKGELFNIAYEKCKADWPKLTKYYFHQKTFSLKTEEDWSFIVSLCNQEEKRGTKWTKVFWGSLKPIKSK